ncbi:hypothetical protein [Arhodomonas sp. AD133]|uniref:hypothetical protein n=1 Tax=Arhodomonas sp. AD133 TaxID=3415009 RepID=UPI003EBF5505
MGGIYHLTWAMTEAERNDRVHAGGILVFRGFRAVGELIDMLRTLCRQHLGNDPEHAHQRMTQSELDAAADALDRAVAGNAAVANTLNTAFSAIGVDLDCTYGDGVKQRVLVPHGRSDRGSVAPLAAHRDTWGSNVMCQTNWWAPVFPTTPERTIALFPAYFERPVPNDSAGWDFRELLRHRKAGQPDNDYPVLPLATVPPPWTDAVPISLVPGDLMCFSGAHLHASVPNTTDRCRLSFETRTVNADDVTAGRGAPNVDGAPVRTTYQLFRNLITCERLGELAEA